MHGRRKLPSVAFQVQVGAGADACDHQVTGATAAINAILRQSRKSGQLNLSNRSLTEVPSSVWRINIDTPEEGKTISLDNADDRWWEQIDLTKLILASNTISSLSDDIKLLSALTILDVHDNRLTNLPDALCELKCLTRLNISHNQVTHLPKDLPVQLTLLQTLHVQHNRLSSLPENMGCLGKLEDLDVSFNQISSLPADIGSLSRLLKLNVASNQLGVLPYEIGNLQSLKTLEAANNQFHSLPSEIGLLRSLELLYMQNNQLTHLPTLELCSSVKEIHLGNNVIQGIAAETLLPLQKSLCFLDLRNNRLSKLPDEISLLKSLERLDVSNNDLSILPYSLGTMVKLKSVVLDGNPMRSIRRDIIMRGTNEVKKYLQSRIEKPKEDEPCTTSAAAEEKTSVSVAKTGMSGLIGAEVDSIDRHRVASTKTIHYNGKKAETVPDEIWEIAVSANITILNLSKNSLQDLPEKLSEIGRSLQELNLSFNRLAKLQPFFGQLVKLVVLDLSNNMLMTLPDEMGSLQSLRELILSVNRFQTLPSVVYKLKKLEVLLASDNKIDTIEVDGFMGLTQLATLDLRNNNISLVPPQLGLCTQLRSCQLEGNAFRQPRAAILAKGTGPLLEYLRDRIPS